MNKEYSITVTPDQYSPGCFVIHVNNVPCMGGVEEHEIEMFKERCLRTYKQQEVRDADLGPHARVI